MIRRWQPDGSVAVVTGASSGVGRSLVGLLVRRGCRVIAVARRERRLQELVDESPAGLVHPVAGDVTNPAVRQAALDAARSDGRATFSLLVNNAGIGAIGPFAKASPERLRRIMEVNFFAPAEWMRDAIPRLSAAKDRHPVICNISSVLGHRGVPNKSEYCASKFALHGLTDAVRAELIGSGIQCTLVSPSTTDSEFFDALVDTDSAAKSVSIGVWSADRVARATLAAITLRRSEVICSLAGKALVYADRLSPPLVNTLLSRTSSPRR